MGENATNFSVNSKLERYFEFFTTVLIIKGIFGCRDLGIDGEKGSFSGKKGYLLGEKGNFCRKKGGD